MIKRRFYRYEHGDKDAPSESSSSDSEVEVEATDETEYEEEEEEEEEENENAVVRRKGETSSSGYESEDSSANEVNLDSSGMASSDDDVGAQNGAGAFATDEVENVFEKAPQSPEKDESPFDVKDCVVKCKSVFKCRLCPRIVCLSEETLKAHLSSKRHARSEKLYKEGRLKVMLNSEGRIEGEIHHDNDDTSTVSTKSPTKSKKKGKGQWKQRKRSKQDTRSGKARPSSEKRGKRQKNE
ncbi:uncharacterized protein LOC127248891 [Andrographis paniculata]|uniref:uncharacterized protein LOC127248891 n=1 Tax=Andrographis paniculata TaxID=175694 RepID=UPI0021E85D78|nr:uncharacterized protein LOC127248891 [Andrographis paniculata]